MFNKIVTPLDGSDVAEQVLPYVRPLAVGLETPVELVLASGIDGKGTIDDRVKAEEYLKGVAKSFANLVPVAYVVRDGNPVDVIVDAAKEHLSTLIAMATHGRSGLARWAMGSVADKVLHSAPNPLLLVRAQKDTEAAQTVTIKNVIVPLDGSPLAEQVLPLVAAIARSLGAKVYPTWVVPPAPAFYGDYVAYSAETYKMLYEDTEKAAAEYLGKIKTRLNSAGVRDVENKVLLGSPAGAIVDLTEEIPDALVTMTTHGRSGVGRFVLGSVADRVVSYSKRPVLLVRAREEDAPQD